MVKVFLTLLALKDSDQVVRHNAFAIGRRCWPRDDKAEVKVLDALKILSSPDRRRLEPQPNEGRRIQKVEDGWMLLNGQFYEDMMRNLNRRAYKAKKQREYREKSKTAPSGREGRFVAADAAGDVGAADRIVAEGLPAGEGDVRPGDEEEAG